MFWTPQRLGQEGSELNRALRDRFRDYAGGGLISLDQAVAFSCLCIANNTDDLGRRDQLIALLHQPGPVGDSAYKALKIRRWSPVKKAIEVFAPLVKANNTPDLSALLAQQSEKNSMTKPSWATLRPDKVYALAHFWGLSDQTGRLMTPFGRAVQSAYSQYSGVSLRGQPTPSHHVYLQGFERQWARWGSCEALDINSGLQRYAEDHLL